MAMTEALVNDTAEAVIQAYNDYANKPVTSPAGYAWTKVSYFGWEGLNVNAPVTTEKFALIFRSTQTPGLYLVAFRGTQTPDEWVADGTFPTDNFPGTADVGVARGFLNLYIKAPDPTLRPMRDALLADLKAAGPTQVIVTGHSLGSALAALFAYDVCKSLNIKPTLVTYACPNVGKDRWAAAFNAAVSEAYRIVNHQDAVPHLPPTLLGYKPVGSDWVLQYQPQELTDQLNVLAAVTNHSMSNYQYVANHAIARKPFVGTFPDLSGHTNWPIQSEDPATAGNPIGAALASLKLDVVQRLKQIHGV